MKYLNTLYLLTICIFLPLYMKDGYNELGEAKGVAFLIIAAVYGVLYILAFLLDKRKRVTDDLSFFLNLLIFSNLITLFFSLNKGKSFLGIPGWRMGFCTSIFFIVSSYFIIRKGAILSSYIVYALLITPFFCEVLGILHRFGIYPFKIYGQNPSFLSTIGNINWFAGFLSIFVPLGIGISYHLSVSKKKLINIDFIAASIYEIAGLMALIVQGSDGAVLILVSVYLCILFISLSKRETLKSFLISLFKLGLSMTILEVILMMFPYSLNYEESIMIMLLNNRIGVIILAFSLFALCLNSLLKELKTPFSNRIYRSLLGIALLFLMVAICIIAPLELNQDFGNGRGIIYRISFDMFTSLKGFRKLVGVGQDGFSVYAYNDQFFLTSLLNLFGNNVLTNAHSIILTTLIEKGLIGFIAYGVFFGAFFYKAKKEHIEIFYVLPVIAFLVYGLVSFSQICAAPYLYAVMALALRNQRRE